MTINKSPLFSVIILSWNRKDDTLAAIQSVFLQNNCTDSLECVVVDQGSSDGSVEEIEKFKDQNSNYNINLIKLQRNLGVPGGRNVGIQHATGEILVILDNDAELDKDALKIIKEKLDKDPSIGVLSFLSINYFTRKPDLSAWVYPTRTLAKIDEEFEGLTYCGGGHAIRASVFKEVGHYDDILFFSNEEEDLSFRIIERGHKIVYTPKIKIYHKVSPTNKFSWGTNRYYFFVRNRLYLCWKYLPLIPAVSRSLMYIIGYPIKAIPNKTLKQAVKGIFNAFKLFPRAFSLRKPVKFSTYKKMRTIDQKQRGNLWLRLRYELLSKKT
jgi:GT2 family glycosyltransferase